MKKTVKAVRKVSKPEKGVSRWTVRGVTPRLQKTAAEAARAEGMTVGTWLNRLLTDALAGRLPAPPVAEAWRVTVESRLARLEEALEVTHGVTHAHGGAAAGTGQMAAGA